MKILPILVSSLALSGCIASALIPPPGPDIGQHGVYVGTASKGIFYICGKNCGPLQPTQAYALKCAGDGAACGVLARHITAATGSATCRVRMNARLDGRALGGRAVPLSDDDPGRDFYLRAVIDLGEPKGDCD